MTEVTDPSLVKQEYLTTFFSKYTDLVQYVNSLPMHQQIKLNALMRLDEGMFWVREGIVHLQTAIPEVPPTPQIPDPALCPPNGFPAPTPFD